MGSSISVVMNFGFVIVPLIFSNLLYAAFNIFFISLQDGHEQELLLIFSLRFFIKLFVGFSMNLLINPRSEGFFDIFSIICFNFSFILPK